MPISLPTTLGPPDDKEHAVTFHAVMPGRRPACHRQLPGGMIGLRLPRCVQRLLRAACPCAHASAKTSSTDSADVAAVACRAAVVYRAAAAQLLGTCKLHTSWVAGRSAVVIMEQRSWYACWYAHWALALPTAPLVHRDWLHHMAAVNRAEIERRTAICHLARVVSPEAAQDPGSECAVVGSQGILHAICDVIWCKSKLDQRATAARLGADCTIHSDVQRKSPNKRQSWQLSGWT